MRIDVPYAAEHLPTALGRSTPAQLAEQTGGPPPAPGDPGAPSRATPRWPLRVPLLVLAVALFLVSAAARLLTRGQFRRP